VDKHNTPITVAISYFYR